MAVKRKRKPPAPTMREVFRAFADMSERLDKLEQTCVANWGQLNAWHSNPANDVQALSERLDKAQDRNTGRIDDLNEEIKLVHRTVAQLQNKPVELLIAHHSSEIAELSNRIGALDDVVAARIDGTNEAVVELQRENIERRNHMSDRELHGLLGRVGNLEAQLGEWQRREVAPAPITAAPQGMPARMIIFQVWWPGQGERDVRPLALRPDDIFRVKPSGHEGFTEIEALQLIVGPGIGKLDHTIYRFVVEGEFTEIVGRINS